MTSDVSHVFEARDPSALSGVLDRSGDHRRVAVVAKDPGRVELLRQARDAAPQAPYTLIVTGDAATVHAVRRDSRGWPQTPAWVKGKAYWAEGRTGLD